jgi:uncharacterized membrane protein/BMFP domain-containing protein YqiC
MGQFALLVSTDAFQDVELRTLRSPAVDAEALERVLADPEIGDYSVRRLHNAPSYLVQQAIEEFFADRSNEDLLLLYFSGHGVKDEHGQFYLAAINTSLRRLGSTTVPSDYVDRQMHRTQAKRIVVLLDCCYSGAFTRGMTPRAGIRVDVEERFAGRGRAVITASTAMEYAFELENGPHVKDRAPTPSIFTSALVRGLATGEADRDEDGLISADELYNYVFDRVREQTTRQTPSRRFDVEGDLIIAKRRSPALPEDVQAAIEDSSPATRRAVVPRLYRLAFDVNSAVAIRARQALERLADDDSRMVMAEARQALAALTQPPLPPPEASRTVPPPQPLWEWSGSAFDANKLTVAWQSGLACLFGFISGWLFWVISKRREVRFHAMQSILFDGFYVLFFIATAAVAAIYELIRYGGEGQISDSTTNVVVTLLLIVYFGGRGLLIVQAIRVKHFRFPVMGKIADALVLRR